MIREEWLAAVLYYAKAEYSNMIRCATTDLAFRDLRSTADIHQDAQSITEVHIINMPTLTRLWEVTHLE